jgi:hypothetical protein
MAQTKGLETGDLIVYEQNPTFCRETLTIKANNTFVVGQVGCRDGTGDIVTIANGNDHVWTLTMAAGTDGGNFALAYRGAAIAVQAYNVAVADLQTALRALHADLDACVVATAGGVGVDYTITVTHEKLPKDAPSIEVVQDSTADGGVWEGGIHISKTTLGEPPCCIVLEACEETSDASRVCLVRNAVVDASNVTGQSADVNKRLAEYMGSDDYENSAAYGAIIVRIGPTYTTL